jgi:sec-independent protein translocase protein TatB
MFEIGGTELLLVAIVALLVIGPKELPNALRQVGKFTGKARAMTRHLRSGFDEMMRQAELDEMQKQWDEHNRKIMAETPGAADVVPADPMAHAAPPGPVAATDTEPKAGVPQPQATTP